MLTRRLSEHGTRNHDHRPFGKSWTKTMIKDKFLMMQIWWWWFYLSWFYLCSLNSNILFMDKTWLEIILDHLFTHQIWKQYLQYIKKDIATNFRKLIKIGPLGDIHWNPPEMELHSATKSDHKHHNTVKFLAFVVSN